MQAANQHLQIALGPATLLLEKRGEVFWGKAIGQTFVDVARSPAARMQRQASGCILGDRVLLESADLVDRGAPHNKIRAAANDGIKSVHPFADRAEEHRLLIHGTA